MKKRWYIKWIVSIAIAISIVMIYLFALDVFNATDAIRVYYVLTNAFFVSGVLMVGVGLLIFASNEGTFDIFVYGLQAFANLFRKDKSKMKYATFYDYRVAHESQKLSFGHLILIGVIEIGIMFIFLDLYHKV